MALVAGGLFCSLPAPTFGRTVAPEEVARQLVAAFTAEPGGKAPKSAISEKEYVGLRTKTVTFAIGTRVYRLVFSSDGAISVSLMNEGDLAAQPLWNTDVSKTSVEELVNVVYSREFGRRYLPGRTFRPDRAPGPDEEEARFRRRRDFNPLTWNNLMSSFLRGETPVGGGGKSGSDIARAAALAGAADLCKAESGPAAPARAAVVNIAQAMAALRTGGLLGGDAQLLAERSRQFEKKGTYSFLSDLEEHERTPNPEEAFRLIRQSAGDAQALFAAALRDADADAKDPYALAALRNFKAVARGVGEKRGKELIDRVLARTVVDIDGFTMVRRAVPKTPVVYARDVQRVYVDPTLNSPSEARYLLSLALLYEWKLTQTETVALLARYDEVRKRITLIEHAILDEQDEKRLASARSEAERLSAKLFAVAEHLRRAPSRPDR